MALSRPVKSVILRSLFFALVLEAMLVAAIEFWPAFKENMGALKLMGTLPVIQDMMQLLTKGGFTAYAVSQHWFKGCNTLGSAAAVLFAMNAIAGEAQRGTLEIFLARPLSRRRQVLERFAAGALALTLPVFATSLTLPWLAERAGESFPLGVALSCSVLQSAFLLVLYAITFFFSAVGRTPIKIAFGMLFFVTFEFAIYMVKTVTQTSIYRLVDIEAMLHVADDGIPLGRTALLVGIAAAFLFAALQAVERRVP